MATQKKNVKKKPRINRNLKCTLCADGIQELSYKDVYRLNRFLTRRGKIVGRLRTGTCAKHQLQIVNAVKNARYMALIPYSTSL